MIVTVDLFKLIELGLLALILVVAGVSLLAKTLAVRLSRWWNGPGD